MSRYRVVPDGSGWAVKKNGRTKSNHRKKRPAINSARRMADSGDSIEIRRSNGTVQDTRTVR